MRARIGLFVLLAAALALSACQDQRLRHWATGIDAWADSVHTWQTETVLPGLRAYCELERHVYDDFHPGALTPVRRYCPKGGTDPVIPPGTPPTWDQ
jgi:hypothetical protein